MPENLLGSFKDLKFYYVDQVLKLMADNPNLLAVVTKNYFKSPLKFLFKSERDGIKAKSQAVAEGQGMSTFRLNKIAHSLSYVAQTYKGFITKYGSDQFEWRLSPEEISKIFDVIIIRKFEPWRDHLQQSILRVVEARLLYPADPVDVIPNNVNPHV